MINSSKKIFLSLLFLGLAIVLAKGLVLRDSNTVSFLGTKIFPVHAQAGTPISNCVELQNINLDLTADYYLAQSFSCSATNPGDPGNPGSIWDNGGLGFEPIGVFGKSFDGQGFTITDLYINRPMTDYVGLFTIVGLNASIDSLLLQNVSIEGHNNVGALGGQVAGSLIENIYVNGSVTGVNSVGGIVGQLTDSTINRSHSDTTVSGNDSIGGVAGFIDGSSVNDTYFSGAITGTTKFAGIVGSSDFSIAFPKIRRTYNSGSVTVGGKGILGFNSGTSCYDSFWDTTTTGVGTDACPAGSTGLPTAQMKIQSTFDPLWDFTTPIWIIINEGVNYPCLSWQESCSPAAPALGNFLMGMPF